MLRRLTRRAFALAAVTTLVFSGAVLADSVAADGDVASGVQTFVDLGTVAPGATVSRDVAMTLFCSGLNHVDPGQVVNLSQAEVTVPAEGGSISATSTTVGPVPAGWAIDTAGRSGCSAPMHVDSSVPSHVTLVAPTTPGLDYGFSISYGRTLTPAGVSDGSSVSGFTIVSFSLDVEDLDSTPPTLVGMPAATDLVTADPAGMVLDYEFPTATDDVDPAPTVACDPAPGAHILLGVTTVTCTATDASGNSASASFEVVVHLGSVEWGDPVGDQPELTVSLGRSLPLKARAWLDTLPLAGPASFEVWSCAARSSGPVLTATAVWQPDADRWMAVLDTSALAIGCHTVALVQDGTALGSFTLQVVDPPVVGPAGYGGSNRFR
jgi:hypothetical protein